MIHVDSDYEYHIAGEVVPTLPSPVNIFARNAIREYGDAKTSAWHVQK